MTVRPPAGRRRGRIESFDDAAGYGAVGDGDQQWFFHCTAIADGSRTITIGTEVDFVLRPGHRGHWEAADLRPI